MLYRRSGDLDLSARCQSRSDPGRGKRIQAHLLEFWLFVDDPRAIGNRGSICSARTPACCVCCWSLSCSSRFPRCRFFSCSTPGTERPRCPWETVSGHARFRRPGQLGSGLHRAGGHIRRDSARARPELARGELAYPSPARFVGRIEWGSGSTRPSKSVIAGDGNRYHWSVWFLASSVLGAILGRYFIRAAAIRSRS